MNNFRLKYAAAYILGSLLVGAVAFATMPKTWSQGETLTAADLNANFAHAEASFRGGGHTLIANADLSTGAAIAHSKLATPALVPKAWTYVYSSTPCDGSGSATCTRLAGSGVTSVVGAATNGLYTVTLTTARANVAYGVLITSHTATAACFTTAPPTSTTVFTVQCLQLANGVTATNANFTLMILDND